MEKVINEIKVIETDDGFRIEIKGNKEAIRRMLHGFGTGFPFGDDFQFFRHGSWNCFSGWRAPWQETGEDKKKA